MENFRMHNPTTVHFGRDVVNGLGKAISPFGKRVLLVYGQGSIRKNGIYDQVMNQLEGIGAEVTKYGGIRPNPVVEDVDAAAALGREKGVDVVLAIGGGSVIDSAKVISITIPVEHSGWDFYEGLAKPAAAVPLISVLTLAATGTEMNPVAVLQHNDLKRKIGFGHPLMYPRHSFLDPSYTLSVNAGYTAYGIADVMAHALEIWFGDGHAPLSDRFILAILQEAMEAGPLLMQDLDDYELRARIMYAATMALNGMTAYGKKRGDWGVHAFGHVLSSLYDIPHGATLTIVYPAWLRLMKDRIPERISALGRPLFGTEDTEETIRRLEGFWKSLGCPVRLVDHYPNDGSSAEIVEVMRANRANGVVHQLKEDDYHRLVELYTL